MRGVVGQGDVDVDDRLRAHVLRIQEVGVEVFRLALAVEGLVVSHPGIVSPIDQPLAWSASLLALDDLRHFNVSLGASGSSSMRRAPFALPRCQIASPACRRGWTGYSESWRVHRPDPGGERRPQRLPWLWPTSAGLAERRAR